MVDLEDMEIVKSPESSKSEKTLRTSELDPHLSRSKKVCLKSHAAVRFANLNVWL